MGSSGFKFLEKKSASNSTIRPRFVNAAVPPRSEANPVMIGFLQEAGRPDDKIKIHCVGRHGYTGFTSTGASDACEDLPEGR